MSHRRHAERLGGALVACTQELAPGAVAIVTLADLQERFGAPDPRVAGRAWSKLGDVVRKLAPGALSFQKDDAGAVFLVEGAPTCRRCGDSGAVACACKGAGCGACEGAGEVPCCACVTLFVSHLNCLHGGGCTDPDETRCEEREPWQPNKPHTCRCGACHPGGR